MAVLVVVTGHNIAATHMHANKSREDLQFGGKRSCGEFLESGANDFQRLFSDLEHRFFCFGFPLEHSAKERRWKEAWYRLLEMNTLAFNNENINFSYFPFAPLSVELTFDPRAKKSHAQFPGIFIPEKERLDTARLKFWEDVLDTLPKT